MKYSEKPIRRPLQSVFVSQILSDATTSTVRPAVADKDCGPRRPREVGLRKAGVGTVIADGAPKLRAERYFRATELSIVPKRVTRRAPAGARQPGGNVGTNRRWQAEEIEKPPFPEGRRRLRKPEPSRECASSVAFLVVLAQLTSLQRVALTASTAQARLAPFRRAYGGHENPALELYNLDAKLASHIHAHLRIVEVVLRQHMHKALAAQYGPRWFDNATGANISKEARERVQAAYQSLNPRGNTARRTKPPAADKVVATVMLGFWVALLRTPNDVDHVGTLWTPALHGEFNALAPVGWTQRDALVVCQRLNWARNRVNHCESVVFGFPQPGQKQQGQIRYSPAHIVDDCRTLVGRFSPELEKWMRASGAIDDLISDEAAQRALAYSGSLPKRLIIG